MKYDEIKEERDGEIFSQCVIKWICFNIGKSWSCSVLGLIYKKISLYMLIIIVLMSITDYFLSKLVSTFLIVKGELKLIRSEY